MKRNYVLGLLTLFFTADTVSRAQIIFDNTGYELVFSDEFNLPNGSHPDPAVWSRKPRNNDMCNRWNSESNKVVYINNGSLVCRAIPNKSEPNDTARMLAGSVWTFGKYNVKYGKIEVRMRTNNKAGSFPAAWLKWQPVDWNTDPYAEIDIVEMFGNRGLAYQTIHSQLTVSDKRHGLTNSFSTKIDVTKWHVYAIEWTPTYVTFAIDGTPVGTYRKSDSPRLFEKGQWTFDVPCYIVLNQSVGEGPTFGTGNFHRKTYETRFDWIRVYQKKH